MPEFGGAGTRRGGEIDEQPAFGVVGFLLYMPHLDKHIFRIYSGEGKDRTFQDYDLACEDVKVQILSGGTSLYRMSQGRGRLDWSSEVLGRKPIDEDRS